MFVKSYGSAVVGIEAITVAVEVNITAGIGLYMVGLPDNAVRESQERIRAAFENCSYKMSGRKGIVNLAPADIRRPTICRSRWLFWRLPNRWIRLRWLVMC